MRTRARSVALGAIAAALAIPPAAAMSPIASVEIAHRDYDARERTPEGTELNRERGGLDGVALGLAVDSAWGRWSVQAAHEQGDAGYTGVSQTGIPVRTVTDLRVQRLELRWEPAWQVRQGNLTLGGHAGLAHQRLDRAIRASDVTGPLTEELDATWLRGGMQLSVSLAASWTLQAEAHLAWPLQLDLGVDSFGVHDNFSLQPRRRISDLIAAGVTWQATSRVRAGLWLSRRHWRFGRSSERPLRQDGVMVGTAAYPGSDQLLDGVSLRLEYQF